MNTTEINNLRKQLDSIDDSIASLLSERVSIASKIVSIKKNQSLSVEDLSREHEIIDRISMKNQNIAPLLKDVFRRVFDWVKSH